MWLFPTRVFKIGGAIYNRQHTLYYQLGEAAIYGYKKQLQL